MKLEKYTVASHTCGAFTKESELNPESLRQYNITKNRMDILTKEIIGRISNLYCINQFDANKYATMSKAYSNNKININIVIENTNTLNYDWLLDAIEATIQEHKELEVNDFLIWKDRNITSRKQKHNYKIYIGEK